MEETRRCVTCGAPEPLAPYAPECPACLKASLAAGRKARARTRARAKAARERARRRKAASGEDSQLSLFAPNPDNPFD